MKRRGLLRALISITAASAVILALPLALSSCTLPVNWFGETYHVAWYVVILPALALLIAAHILLLTYTYVCPKCKNRFKVKWYQISVWLHFCGRRMAKCPFCHHTSYCDIDKHRH